MKKEQAFWVAILVLVLGAFAGVYQFYFKTKLEMYAKDAVALKNAEDAYRALRTKFQGIQPDAVISAWSAVVEPWKEAVLERGKYFNDANWKDHTKPADDVPILRFWYDEQLRKDITKLYTEFQQSPGLQAPPVEQLLAQFNVMTLDKLPGEADATLINRELGKFAFGAQTCRMLVKAKAAYISQVHLWPGRELKVHEGMLRLWTVGLEFGMNMRDFVNFVDNNLRTADRYFNIDGIKIEYPYVGYNTEPMLRIQMLLTTAYFVEDKAGIADGADIGAVAVGGNPTALAAQMNLRGTPTAPVVEETGFWAWWRWFRTDILYMPPARPAATKKSS